MTFECRHKGGEGVRNGIWMEIMPNREIASAKTLGQGVWLMFRTEGCHVWPGWNEPEGDETGTRGTMIDEDMSSGTWGA